VQSPAPERGAHSGPRSGEFPHSIERITLFLDRRAILAGMFAEKSTADRYIARAADSGSFDVWDTRTDTNVLGCTALAESIAIDKARRLSEAYRRVLSDAAKHRAATGD
jgi:hypothetical protein